MNTTKKVLAKRSADFLEKLAVGSMVAAMFDGRAIGFILGVVFLLISYSLSVMEANYD